jgi:hypothetical protein
MDKVCYVYGLYDKSNCIIRYIGVSLYPEKRFKNHIHESKNSKTANLGKSKWLNTCSELNFRILFKGTSEECYVKEIELITKYKKKRNLVNATIGGDKPPTINNLPKELYNQVIDKIKNSKVGNKLSEETKKKMSESHKKNPPLWLKSKGSDNGRAYPVFQYDLQGNFIKKWECAKYAVTQLNLNKTAISDCLKGRQKTAGGYIWSTRLY